MQPSFLRPVSYSPLRFQGKPDSSRNISGAHYTFQTPDKAKIKQLVAGLDEVVSAIGSFKPHSELRPYELQGPYLQEGKLVTRRELLQSIHRITERQQQGCSAWVNRLFKPNAGISEIRRELGLNESVRWVAALLHLSNEGLINMRGRIALTLLGQLVLEADAGQKPG